MHRTFLFIPLLSITCHLATAWSGLGHCTVGYLAETFFTDAASSMVNDLLRNDDGDDICDVATWADKVKFTHAFEGTDVWHFIGM
jgi:S1/P1 Nuclease